MDGSIASPAASPTNGTANGTATSSFPIIDSLLVVEYLASVLEITLGATRKDLESFGSLLSKSKYTDTSLRCARFATESQTALYVQKDIAFVDGPENGADTTGIVTPVLKFPEMHIDVC